MFDVLTQLAVGVVESVDLSEAEEEHVKFHAFGPSNDICFGRNI